MQMTSLHRSPAVWPALAAATLALVSSVGCASTDEVEVIAEPPSKEEREALAPRAALQEIKDGNLRFVAGAEFERDWKSLIEGSMEGAHPLAAVLTTTDPRVLVPRALDQAVGDVVCVRTLGATPTDAAVQALERAVVVDGVKELVVLMHGDCAELYAAYLGENGTLPMPGPRLVQEAKSAVGPDMQPLGGVLSEINLEDSVTIELGSAIVRDLIRRSNSLREAMAAGRLGAVVGYYDVGTGAIAWFDAPE